MQLAPIFFPTPIIVVPSYNQQQSVSIQKGSAEENYEEVSGMVETITTSAKLVDATMTSVNDDVDIIRQPPKREVGGSDINAQLRQATSSTMPIINSSVSISDTTTTPVRPSENVMTGSTESTMTTSGKYPTALSNDTIDNLTITTGGLNGTQPENFTVDETSLSKPIKYPSPSPVGGYGVPYPYSAANYDNTFLNHLVLTTEEPIKEASLPPKSDQRWQQFASLNNLVLKEGFRPLAGLYYDGFLHTPLMKMNGWTPNF